MNFFPSTVTKFEAFYSIVLQYLSIQAQLSSHALP